MPGRVAAALALVAAEPPSADGTEEMVDVLRRLCIAAARSLAASGAGVSVMTDDGVRVLAAASGPASERIDDLQFSLGEGPCTEAFATRRPVLEPDLVQGMAARWPAYSSAAHDEGVRAVFAFPLQIGAARLGVLDLYREQAGSLSPEQLTRALTFADLATSMLLDGQQAAPRGAAAKGLDEAMEYRFEVHQAQGMVMVQTGASLPDALTLLRAHAYTNDRALGDVARDVVSRTLRLDRDDT